MIKRTFLLLSTFTLLLFLLFLRLYALTASTTLQTAYAQNGQKTVTLYHTRSPIYDRNFTSLTDQTILKAVTICGVSACYTAPVRDHSAAPHILGYLQDGIGMTGIEAAYNDLLTAEAAPAKATLHVLGTGERLADSPITFTQPASPKSGVVLTLDATLQQLVTDCESILPKGAIVCMDADTAEILALASFPSYTAVSDALTDPDTPLYNRAFGGYAVGSVLKPILAAAALESGISPHTAYTCSGSTTVGEIRFGCHNAAGHGTLNLIGALCASCNPYFVQLTADLPTETLLSTVKSFGFGQQITLAPGMQSAAGTLPDALPAGEKANFSFGQGKITATPLQICAAYAALANGGTYRTPSLVRGTTSDGITLTDAAAESLPQTVITADTARIINDALYKAVNASESSLARSEEKAVYGKTGTAQTGRYEAGEEILIGWFAGWFEAGNKKIAITVMAENAVSGNVSAAGVVKRIAEGC